MAATTTWYIDPRNGKDAWPGTDRDHPLKTHDKLREVYEGRPIQGDVEVRLLDDFDARNPVVVDFRLDDGARLRYRGDKPLQTLLSSQLQAVVPIDRVQNQALEIAADGVDWLQDGLVNTSADLPDGSLRRIRLEGSGAVAYACKDLQGNAARTSPFGTPTGPGAPSARRVVPVVGEGFVVESGFVRIDSLHVDVRVSPVGAPGLPLSFQDIELNPGQGHNHYVRAVGPHQGGPPIVLFAGCGVGRLVVQYATKVGFDFCRLGGTRQDFQASLVHVGGCCCLGEVAAFEGARVSAYADTLFQGHSLRIQGFARLGEVAFFDSPGAGLLVEEHGTARVEPLVAPWMEGQGVYGHGNAVGARVLSGGCLVYTGDTSPHHSGVTVTGGNGDVNIAGTPFAWSSGEDLVVANRRAGVVRAA